MNSSDYIATAALVFSMLSFLVTLILDRRTKATERRLRSEETRLHEIAREQANKAEILKSLQGDMEAVGYTAMYFARSGFPNARDERLKVVAALVHASVFCGSDRARAMIYHVLRGASGDQKIEVQQAIREIDALFDRASSWGLDPKELNLERGRRRVAALKKALAASDA